MNLLLAATSVLVLALAGVGLLRFLWPPILDVPRSARLALGYCVGCWFVTMVFFGAYLAGVSFLRWLVVGPVIGLAAVGIFRSRLKTAPTFRWAEWVLPGLLCGLALGLSWGRPVYGYDAVMMWALKAKMMFFARTWPATMFDPFTTAHTEYPPVVPGAQAFVYFWLGEFDDVAARVVFAAWFAAGAAILWWWLGQWCVRHRWAWVVWWCAVPVAMEQVKVTYADLPLAVYLLVFYGAIVTWLRNPESQEWLWLAGIFGGMAFWVKQDAMIGVGVGFAVLLLLRKPVWRQILLAGVIALPWRVLVWVHDSPSDFAFSWTGLPEKTATIAGQLFHFAVVEGGYAFFWVIVVGTLLVRGRRVQPVETLWLATALAVSVVAVFAIYWFSTPDLVKLLKTSADRVLLNLFVPALLLVALLWADANWRGVSGVILASTLILGVVEISVHTRSCFELHRQFGGKTLMQQHMSVVEPALRQQITRALNAYPPGTHVSVLPKRSLWRHRFYYETYPYLIVDSTATNVIHLVVE